jgi:hypothetical protein
MSTLHATHLCPQVHFVQGRSDFFRQDPSHRYSWRRLQPRGEARQRTGFSHETGELHVGIFLEPRPNDRVILGLDIFRTGLTIKPTITEQLRHLWYEEVAAWPRKSSALLRKAHFAVSFVEVPTTRDRVEYWRGELERVLGDPESYEPVSLKQHEEQK